MAYEKLGWETVSWLPLPMVGRGLAIGGWLVVAVYLLVLFARRFKVLEGIFSDFDKQSSTRPMPGSRAI